MFDRDIQGICQVLDTAQRNIAAASFDVGDVGPMEFGAPSQLFLGDPELTSTSANSTAELRLQIGS